MQVKIASFSTVEESEIRGGRLEFNQASKILMSKVSQEQVELYYEDKRARDFTTLESSEKYVSSDKPWADLEPHRKEAEKYYCAQDFLLYQLEQGEITAYVFREGSRAYFKVPERYWQVSCLHTPVDSKLGLLGSEWPDDRGFSRQTFFLLEKYVKSLLTMKQVGKRGPKSVYDRDEVKKKVISLFKHHGPFSPDDREWSCQADLERAIKEFFLERIGREPSTSTARTIATELLQDPDVIEVSN